MQKIIELEEKSPMINEYFSYNNPRQPCLKFASSEGEEDLSFDEVSQRSSEIDEVEARIINFIDEEGILMTNPKEKAWEYAEKVKEKTFMNHSKCKNTINTKRFTLDNADLYNKRRSSCLELSSKFFSPDSTKMAKNENYEEHLDESFENMKLKSIFKRSSTTDIKPFAFTSFKLHMNSEEEKESSIENSKKFKLSTDMKQDLLKDFRLFKTKNESPTKPPNLN